MSRTANLVRLELGLQSRGTSCVVLPSERREVSEGLDTHGLAGGQLDDGRVTRLDELGVVLHGLTGTTVNLLLDLSKLKIRELKNILSRIEENSH